MPFTAWYRQVVSKEAPAGRPAIVVDLDGTVASDQDDDLMRNPPIPGAREALGRIMAAGYDVVIFTCRMNKANLQPREANLRRDEVEEWLRANDIPYSRIEDGHDGKPVAKYYLDNRARKIGNQQDWERFSDEVLEGMASTTHGQDDPSE